MTREDEATSGGARDDANLLADALREAMRELANRDVQFALRPDVAKAYYRSVTHVRSRRPSRTDGVGAS